MLLYPCFIVNTRQIVPAFRKSCTCLSNISLTMSNNRSNVRNKTTAGIIVIGNEILNGQVQDKNTNFLCRKLFILGVEVKKVSVIADDIQTISEEVASFSRQFTHVITSGGIGPTHDDVTFEGVAAAFGDEVVPNPTLVKLCANYFKTNDLSSPPMKMAHIPASSELTFGIDKQTGEPSSYPVVSCQNVVILPGVPSLMRRGFGMIEDNFRNPDMQWTVKELFLNLDEISIAGVLNKANERFKDGVAIGSYPEFHNSYFKVRLSFASEVPAQVDEAIAYVRNELPSDAFVQYDPDPLGNAVQGVTRLLTAQPGDDAVMRDFRLRVSKAYSVIEECLQRYKLSEICVGFNGGKDCTAVLHLFHAAVRKHHPDNVDKLQALYIRSKTPFPEVEEFIKTSCSRYNLELLRYSGQIKANVGRLLEDRPMIKAVVMGTRRTDPFSEHLESFSMTDKDWPQVMRVNPLLDLSYEDVWKVLRMMCVPYCRLYDRGYTSLGSMENTHPNPLLRQVSDEGVPNWRPAYELRDDEHERAGRNPTPKI